MDNGRYKPTRFNKGLREIAEQMGYTPGEFSLMRFAEDAKTLKEWLSFVDAGTVPPELGNLSVREARQLVRKEVADLVERERAWLPFFYPTLKAQDVTLSGNSDAPLTIQIVRHGDRDTE